ncbi:putative WD repeat-containing protein all2124 [Planktothrix rubescens]|nr:putative WD repeat-containing protein all2124 [Planktothrix rubescens]
MEKLVTLNISGEFDKGFVVQAEVRQDGGSTKNQANLAIAGASGKLPPHPELLEQYRHWQSLYKNLEDFFPNRLKKTGKVANASKDEAFDACRKAAKLLAKTLNTWLQSLDFKPIVDLLSNNLQDSTSTRILLATENHWLRRLPWCEWNLLEDIPNAEIVLASPKFKQVKSSGNSGKKEKVKILVILGDNAGTDADEEVFKQLIPDAEICWLKEPQRRDLDAPLWEKQWDILFFAGHGKTENDGSIGKIQINSKDTLTIDEIKNHLKRAINNGLKLAIFNACDGLGIAYQLAEGEDLYLPQIIVMREILPIAIAPKFLQYFLEAYTHGLSLSAAIRDSRKRLQILENDVPCVSWLPVLCQNPAEIPLRWHDLVIPPNPYQGLSAFQEKDAALFFGRETFTNQLVKVVETEKMVAVIGASGSGKSSVVLAGLIPSLRQQGNWLIANLRPESTPFENLAKALLSPVAQLETGEIEGVAEVNTDEINQLATDLQEGNRTLSDVVRSIGSSRRFLLVIDQFEEIYTYPNQKSRQFLDCLLDAVQKFSAFRLVITLRVDFLGQAIEYNPFREQLDKWKPEFIGGMVRTELQAAIEEPAKKRNVYLEAGLTEHILNEVGEEQGNLPLLEFALTELWKQQENGLLNRLKYDEIGGVEKALCRHAEGVYDALKEGDKERTKQIFMKLVSPGEGTEYTRQLATRAEVEEENWDLVTHLATARLVVSNRNETTEIETVEIVHEALIKAWPDLRKWIEENDTFLRWKKRLKVAFLEWERNENKEGYLLQGAPLGEAEGYLLQRLEDVSKAERVFINLSLEQEKVRQQRELEQERKARKAAQTRTIVAVASTVIVSAAGIFAFWQRNEAIKGQINALAAEAESRFSAKDQLGALLASMKTARQLKQSFGLSANDRIQTLVKIQQPIYKIQERNRLEGHSDSVETVSFSPDGKLIASGSADKTVKLWSRDGTLLKTFEGHTGRVSSVGFSPDSKTIVSSATDGTARLWNVDGTLLKTLKVSAKVTASDVNYVNFSPDGKLIGCYSADNVVQLWNLDGTLFKTISDDRGLNNFAWSPNGQIIATVGFAGYDDRVYNKVVMLWKQDGTLIKSFKVNGDITSRAEVRFSPDGTIIAWTDGDNTIKLFNTDGKLLKTLNKESDILKIGNYISDMKFSPDGKIIAASSGDRTVRILEVNKDEYIDLLITFLGHVGGVNSVSFSPDGKTIASAGSDKTIRLWSMNYPNVIDGGNNHSAFSLGFSLDGKTVTTAASDYEEKEKGHNHSNNVRIWQIDGTLLKTFNIPNNSYRISFSPDGKTFAIRGLSDDKEIPIWNLEGTLLNTIKGHSEAINDISFSPNGKMIASASRDNTVKLWNSEGNLITTIFDGYKNRVNFSYDSKTLVTIFDKIKFWSLDGKLLNTLSIDGRDEVSFSPDTKIIATNDGFIIKLWNLKGNLIKTLIHQDRISDHSYSVTSISFSPDGKMVATGSKDLNLWGLDGRLIATISGYDNEIADIRFSPNGKTIGMIHRHFRGLGNLGYLPSATFWSFDVDSLLVSGCNLLGDYLKTNPNVSDSDRHLCDGISKD